MKVLLVINSSDNGGAQKMIVALYKGMLHFFPDSKIVFLQKINSQYSDVKGAYYLSEKLSRPSDYIEVYKKLKEVFREESPDVTISFLPLSNILSSIIGKNSGVKTRIVSQRNPPQTYGNVVRWVDRVIGSMGYYSHNVCNSEAGMASFDKYAVSYKKNLSVIRNCVEPADFTITKEEAKKSLGIIDDRMILCCVGRLHEQKNHQLLGRTMKHIDNAVLYCAGDGPLREEITALISEYKLTDKIILLGDLERSQVRLLLRASDLFVIPSRYEGLSNSLIEAMAFGLPVVFSNIPSFTNFLKLEDKDDKYAGILVDSDNEKDWASAIQKLIQSQGLLKYYSEQSLLKVADLTSDNMTLSFKKLFIKN
jgi:glycosyltransferase involved in cell wall biosynthesis